MADFGLNENSVSESRPIPYGGDGWGPTN